MTASARRTVDLRLALVAAAAWVSATVVQPMSSTVGFRLAGVGAVTFALCVPRRPVVAAFAVGVAAGATATAVHVLALHRGAVAALAADGATATVDAQVVRDPLRTTSTTGRPLFVVDATVTAVRQGTVTVADRAPVVVFAMSPTWSDLLPGQRLTAAVRLEPPRPGDTVAAAAVATGPPTLHGRPPLWQRLAGAVRDDFRRACVRLPPDAAGLVPGLVLGDVSNVPDGLAQDFRITGLTHLTAVSGANIAILLGAVVAALRRTPTRRLTRTIIAGAALLMFVVLVRPSPSVLRAGVMGAVILLATVTGRRAEAIPTLAAAVLLLVVIDPFLARTPGFAMSVLATAAIVTVAPGWTDRLARRVPRPVAAAIAVPAAAQLACTPVIVATFGRLTPWAIPANVLAAPAVAPATLVGMATAVTAPVAPSVAAALAWVAGLPAAWLAVVARTLSAAPGAAQRWPTGLAGAALVLLAGCLAAAVVGRRRRRSRHAMLATWPP